MRHDLQPLGPNDKIRHSKHDRRQKEGTCRISAENGLPAKASANTSRKVDSLPPDEFAAGLTELARDLIIKEQQIEVLICNLPGLDNSEHDQERSIKDLEEDLKAAEAQRLEALKERDHILGQLDTVIRSVRRP